MKAVAETLGVSRSNLVERLKDRDRPRQRYHKAGDIDLLPALRRLVDERPTYGYRRITALLNRERAATGQERVNHKRVYRLMKVHSLLLAKHTAVRPGRTHDGKVIVMAPNLRWCSDGFEFTCWNGGWIPTRSATRSSKPDLNVISKLGEHGLDGCFESEALSRR